MTTTELDLDHLEPVLNGSPLKHWRFDVAEMRHVEVQGHRPVMFTIARSKEEATQRFRQEWEAYLDTLARFDKILVNGVQLGNPADLEIDFDICVGAIFHPVWVEDVQ